MKNPAPTIPADLLAWLEATYPDTLPARVVPPDELGVMIGRQDVIRRLRSEFDRQNRNVLDAPVLQGTQ